MAKKGAFLYFPINSEYMIFSTPKTRLSIKNQQILQDGLLKNAKNLNFQSFWAKNANYGIFGQNGQKGNFFKKALGKFLSRLQAITNCKVSEKSNERFSSNCVTHARTDERTDANPQVSNDFVERPKRREKDSYTVFYSTLMFLDFSK